MVGLEANYFEAGQVLSLQRRVLRGALWTGSSTVILMPLQVLQLAVLGRSLGTGEFGRYVLLNTVTITAVGLSDFGVTEVLSRRGARAWAQHDHAETVNAARQIATWYYVRLWLPLLLVSFFATGTALAMYAAALAINALSVGPAAVSTVRSEYRGPSIVKVVAAVAAAVSSSGAAIAWQDAELAFGLAALCGSSCNLLLLVNKHPGTARMQPVLPRLPRVDKADLKLGLSAYAVFQTQEFVFGRTELFFFSKAQSVQLGLYAAGQTVAARATLLLDSLFAPLPIALSEAVARRPDATAVPVRSMLDAAGCLMRLTAFPILALSVAVPPLLFGDNYDDAAIVAVCLTALSLLQTYCLTHGAIRFATGRLHATVIIGAAAVTLDIALSITLIPSMGAAGATIAAASAGLLFLASNAVHAHRIIAASVLRSFLGVVMLVLAGSANAVALTMLDDGFVALPIVVALAVPMCALIQGRGDLMAYVRLLKRARGVTT